MYVSIDYHDAVTTLRRGVVRAIFITKDGREREIYATRNVQIIASVFKVKSEFDESNSVSLERKTKILNVFDLQKQDFRKINLHTLLEFGKFSGTIPPLGLNKSAFSDKEKIKESHDKERKNNIINELKKADVPKITDIVIDLDTLEPVQVDYGDENIGKTSKIKLAEDKQKVTEKDIEELF